MSPIYQYAVDVFNYAYNAVAELYSRIAQIVADCFAYLNHLVCCCGDIDEVAHAAFDRHENIKKLGELIPGDLILFKSKSPRVNDAFKYRLMTPSMAWTRYPQNDKILFTCQSFFVLGNLPPDGPWTLIPVDKVEMHLLNEELYNIREAGNRQMAPLLKNIDFFPTVINQMIAGYSELTMEECIVARIDLT